MRPGRADLNGPLPAPSLPRRAAAPARLRPNSRARAAMCAPRRAAAAAAAALALALALACAGGAAAASYSELLANSTVIPGHLLENPFAAGKGRRALLADAAASQFDEYRRIGRYSVISNPDMPGARGRGAVRAEEAQREAHMQLGGAGRAAPRGGWIAMAASPRLGQRPQPPPAPAPTALPCTPAPRRQAQQHRPGGHPRRAHSGHLQDHPVRPQPAAQRPQVGAGAWRRRQRVHCVRCQGGLRGQGGWGGWVVGGWRVEERATGQLQTLPPPPCPPPCARVPGPTDLNLCLPCPRPRPACPPTPPRLARTR
jgi:hypothetical protein